MRSLAAPLLLLAAVIVFILLTGGLTEPLTIGG